MDVALNPICERVLGVAEREAARLRHAQVGSHDILLGLLAEREGGGFTILHQLGVTLEQARVQVRQLVKSDRSKPLLNPMQLTQRSKAALDFARLVARERMAPEVATEHLLLGLLNDEQSVAAQVMFNSGTWPQDVRQAVLRYLG